MSFKCSISFVDVIYFTSNFPMVPAQTRNKRRESRIHWKNWRNHNRNLPIRQKYTFFLETGWPLSHEIVGYLREKIRIKHQPIKTNCFSFHSNPKVWKNWTFCREFLWVFCFGWSFQLQKLLGCVVSILFEGEVFMSQQVACHCQGCETRTARMHGTNVEKA